MWAKNIFKAFFLYSLAISGRVFFGGKLFISAHLNLNLPPLICGPPCGAGDVAARAAGAVESYIKCYHGVISEP
jgi:hypothetical protein